MATSTSPLRSTANTGIGQISIANPLLTGLGAVSLVYTAPAGLNGSLIHSVTVKAIANNSEGMVRLFIGAPAVTPSLYMEIPIPANVQAAVYPAYTHTVYFGYSFRLQPGYQIWASTQVADTYNIIVEGADWQYICCP